MGLSVYDNVIIITFEDDYDGKVVDNIINDKQYYVVFRVHKFNENIYNKLCYVINLLSNISIEYNIHILNDCVLCKKYINFFNTYNICVYIKDTLLFKKNNKNILYINKFVINVTDFKFITNHKFKNISQKYFLLHGNYLNINIINLKQSLIKEYSNIFFNFFYNNEQYNYELCAYFNNKFQLLLSLEPIVLYDVLYKLSLINGSNYHFKVIENDMIIKVINGENYDKGSAIN